MLKVHPQKIATNQTIPTNDNRKKQKFMEKKHGQNETWWQKSTNKGVNYHSKNIK